MRYKTTMLLGILGFGGYHLRLHLKSYYFEDNDGFHHIKDILIKNNITPPKIVYFIADIDDESETNPVFKLNLDEVSNILEECQFLNTIFAH